MSKMTLSAVECLLSDARGVYIPRDFVADFDMAEWGVADATWALDTCAAGPDEEGYWEAWDEIMRKAEFKEGDNVWRLHQDGDLWAVCYELMTDEEKRNFEFEV